MPFWPLGLWLQVGSLTLFAWWSGFTALSPVAVTIVFTLALLADLADAVLVGPRASRRARRRGGIGALAGGGAGAVIGIPFALVGSPFGALIGSIVGAGIGIISGGAATGGVGTIFSIGLRAAAGVTLAIIAISVVWV